MDMKGGKRGGGKQKSYTNRVKISFYANDIYIKMDYNLIHNKNSIAQLRPNPIIELSTVTFQFVDLQ